MYESMRVKCSQTLFCTPRVKLGTATGYSNFFNGKRGNSTKQRRMWFYGLYALNYLSSVLSVRGEPPKDFLQKLEKWGRDSKPYLQQISEILLSVFSKSSRIPSLRCACIHSYTGSWNTLLKIRRNVLMVYPPNWASSSTVFTFLKFWRTKYWKVLVYLESVCTKLARS